MSVACNEVHLCSASFCGVCYGNTHFARRPVGYIAHGVYVLNGSSRSHQNAYTFKILFFGGLFTLLELEQEIAYLLGAFHSALAYIAARQKSALGFNEMHPARP